MKFDMDRHNERAGPGEPSLADMVEKSIKILQKNDNGFFLLVEGTFLPSKWLTKSRDNPSP